MAVTRPRTTGHRDGALTALAALMLAVLIGGCAASTSSGEGSGGAQGSGGANGSGGTTGSDGGTNDGSSPGSGGISGGSGGFLGSGGSTSSGGATSATGGATGSGGISGAGSGGIGAGGSAARPCYVSIEAVSPPTFTAIEAGPNAKLRVRGVANYSTLQAPTFTWMVTSSATGAKVPFTAIETTHRSIIEIKVTDADTFSFVASIDDPTCMPGTKTATAVTSKPGFLFRTTATNFPVQEQRIDWSAGVTVPIDLQSGRQYAIRPLQANQTSNLVRGYLRLTDARANFSLEADTAHGAVTANLLSGAVYNLLIVPDDPTVAPLLMPNQPPETFQAFTVDQGLHVGVRTVDGNGTAIVGARMILKNGDLTSTVGVSNAMGQMDLWTRPGPVSAIIVPPADSGLAQARVDLATDGTGLTIPANTSSYVLTMTWNVATRGALTITVMGSSGNQAVSGARVRASLRASNTPVGVLTASGAGPGDTNVSAMGSNNAELVTDGQGQARFAALPAGTYDVTITPPSGLAPAAITGIAGLKLTSTGLSRTVTLAQKVNLTGTLGPLPASQGVSITAIDTTSDASGSTATAVSGSDGAFTLSVDPSRTYELILQPRPDQALGRMVMRDVMVGATGAALGTINLPASVVVTGNVMNGGKPVPGAFVQVFCVSSSASCADPTISLGDVTTASDGSFQVVLPNLTAVTPK